MTVREQLASDIETLTEPELGQVAEFVAFLKFRATIKTVTIPDETQMAALYGEFANEDRELAEEGMPEYAASLMKEDAR